MAVKLFTLGVLVVVHSRIFECFNMQSVKYVLTLALINLRSIMNSIQMKVHEGCFEFRLLGFERKSPQPQCGTLTTKLQPQHNDNNECRTEGLWPTPWNYTNKNYHN